MAEQKDIICVQEMFDNQITLRELLIAMLLEKMNTVDTIAVSPKLS